MSSLRIAFIGLLLICSISPAASSEVVWNFGVGVGLFSRAGNIAVLQPVIDSEASIIRTRASDASWQLTASQFLPRLQKNNGLNSGRTLSLFLLRGSEIRWKGYSVWLKTGLGIGRYIKKNGDRDIALGTLGFRTDLVTELYSAFGMRLEGGITYVGTVIPSSAYYTDRFGIGIVIVSRPFFSNAN